MDRHHQGIDFLKAARRETLAWSKRKRLFYRLSVALLALYCLIAGAIFAYSVYLDKIDQQLDQNIVTQKEKIASFNQTEMLQVLLKQRLAAIEKIFSQETPDYQKITLFLESLAPSGLTINGYHYSANGEITLEANAANSLVADDFLGKLKSLPEAQKYFSKITLASFSRGSGGAYRLSLVMNTK